MKSVSAGGGRSNDDVPKQRRIGIVYDDRMCHHFTPDGETHPECPDRIRVIWNKLHFAGINPRCVILDAKDAEDEYIASVHTKNHIDLIKNVSSRSFDSRRHRIAANFNSIYFNDGSSKAAYLAAGSVIEAAKKVAGGELDSAFAIVRPPGHHAEENEPMGFCLFNNVAVAANFLLNSGLNIKRILIVDWDVHHGNGTQKMFWKDPRVLFFSVHRHEFGSFYPTGDDGSYVMIGEGPGAGYNINVPWENGRCGDADYLAVWDHILVPVAKEFNPDLIMISAGFDAADGDPLGGCCVTPYGYSILLSKLMEFAGGKIVMALEGGYNLNSLANSALACVEVLLDNKLLNCSSEDNPFESTWRVIKAVRKQLSPFWPSLASELPEKLQSRNMARIQISSSDSDNERDNGHYVEFENSDFEQEVVGLISNLKVHKDGSDQGSTVYPPWRSELSKVDVWYGCFGSNMKRSRFLCYIEGGQDEGMLKPCTGSMDKSPPKDVLWRTVPRRLFFGHSYTKTWGPGGAAFLHPEENVQEKAYMCLYRITLEQFNDVLFQENLRGQGMSSPVFDLNDLSSVMDKKSVFVEALKNGWYHDVFYLGEQDSIPILTMTCSSSDAEDFKSGKVPLCKPGKQYANTLIRGLVEGKQLSPDEAMAYIQEASNKPL